jgi:hypothetical protein
VEVWTEEAVGDKRRAAAGQAEVVQEGSLAALAASAESHSPAGPGGEGCPFPAAPIPGRGGANFGSRRSRFFADEAVEAASPQRMGPDSPQAAARDGAAAAEAAVAGEGCSEGWGGATAVVASGKMEGGWAGETKGYGAKGASGSKGAEGGGGGDLGGGGGDCEVVERGRKKRRVQAADAGTVRQDRSARRVRHNEPGHEEAQEKFTRSRTGGIGSRQLTHR